MSKIPAELTGKTSEEIAEYYQNLIGIQKQTYEQALETLGGGNEPQPPKPNEPPKVSVSEILSDPGKHIEQIISEKGVSRAEFQAASKVVQENLIYIVKQRAMAELKADADKSGGSFDWARMENVLTELSKKCDPASLTNVETWKTIYYYNRGQIADTLVKEGVQRATMPMEPVMPGGNEPAPKTPLTPEQKTVAEGLGLTEDTYREGAHRMKQNKFPLTMDNRNRR